MNGIVHPSGSEIDPQITPAGADLIRLSSSALQPDPGPEAVGGNPPSSPAPDRHRLLFENNIAGAFRATLDGRLLECNRAFARLLGYDAPAELLASARSMPGPLAFDHAVFPAQLVREGSLNQLKIRGRRKDGSRMALRGNVMLLPAAGGAPAEIEGTVAGEPANGAGGRAGPAAVLARGVVHDVNNLLTAVIGDCELLAHQCRGDPEAEKLLEGARTAGEWAACLASRLLDSPARGRAARVLDLNQLVSLLAPTLRKLLGKRIALATSLHPEPVWVRGDSAPLGGAILNLVLNARDAMPRGGRLAIETTRGPANAAGHDTSSFARGGYGVLVVTDSGAGMDGETRARIFDPGFTTKRRGQGLGLAMVREVVERAGGKIEVESSLGSGSSFRLYLPEAPPAVPRPRRERPRPARPNATILLVEDEARVREVVRLTLEAAGHKVLVAADAGDAVTVAREHGGSLDLLVTDVTMPEMSGWELAASLRAAQPELKVLVMSGNTHRVPAPGGGDGTGFIAKPFKPGSLVEKVEVMLEARSAH